MSIIVVDVCTKVRYSRQFRKPINANTVSTNSLRILPRLRCEVNVHMNSKSLRRDFDSQQSINTHSKSWYVLWKPEEVSSLLFFVVSFANCLWYSPVYVWNLFAWDILNEKVYLSIMTLICSAPYETNPWWSWCGSFQTLYNILYVWYTQNRNNGISYFFSKFAAWWDLGSGDDALPLVLLYYSKTNSNNCDYLNIYS